MEIYQDITCVSRFEFSGSTSDSEKELDIANEYLKIVHQLAVDSLHSTNKFNALYKNIIDEKANALLMDEETIDFNHYNMNIVPSQGIVYAVNYLEALLSVLGKYSPEICKDLKR